MFSQACVKNSLHRGEVYTAPGRHPPGQTPPWAENPPGQTPREQTPPPGMHSGYVFFQTHFLRDHHCKTQSDFIEMLKNSPNLLNILQGD